MFDSEVSTSSNSKNTSIDKKYNKEKLKTKHLQRTKLPPIENFQNFKESGQIPDFLN